jgi:transcriptional regulator with XRE-family HTH domain
MFRKNKKKFNTDEAVDRLLAKISPELQRQIDFKMDLAVKIFNGMKSKGWNKSQFAEQMGISNSIITRWLSGTHNFESDTLFDIQNKLGIRLLDCSQNVEGEIYTFPTSNPVTFNIFLPQDPSHILQEIESVEISEFGLQVISTVKDNCN